MALTRNDRAGINERILRAAFGGELPPGEWEPDGTYRLAETGGTVTLPNPKDEVDRRWNPVLIHADGNLEWRTLDADRAAEAFRKLEPLLAVIVFGDGSRPELRWWPSVAGRVGRRPTFLQFLKAYRVNLPDLDVRSIPAEDVDNLGFPLEDDIEIEAQADAAEKRAREFVVDSWDR